MMFRRLALALAALITLAPTAEASGISLFLHVPPLVQVVNSSPSIATISPDSTWQGTPGSSTGSTPTTGAVPSSAVAGEVTTGGGDGVAYGSQAISAVSTDANMHGVPQITVTSTALMSEGDEFRVNGTGVAGLDGQWQLHIIDGSHVDLCHTILASGDCTVSATLVPSGFPASLTSASYSGGGQIWFDEAAIAQWDEHPLPYVEQAGYTITVGAATGARAGIKDIRLCAEIISANTCADVTQQTISPTHNTFGWSVQPTSFGSLFQGNAKDGIANLYAIVTPYNGFQRVIGPLPVVLNTNRTIQHPAFFVDNTDPLASDGNCNGKVAQGDLSETSLSCPWLTIEKGTSAAAAASVGAGPVVNVGGPAGQLYSETGSGNFPASASPYPITIVGNPNQVYVTGAGASKTVWNIRAKNVILQNLAVDDEVGSFQAASTASMLWFGQGSKLVSWGGLAGGAGCATTACNYGAPGPAYGYVYPGNYGPAIGRGDTSSFVGIGESSFDTITSAGLNMYRNVTGYMALDAIQHGGSAVGAGLSVWNYHPQPIYTSTTRFHNENTLTVASVGACYTKTSNNNTSWNEDVTWTTPPYDNSYANSHMLQAPDLVTFFTGAAGNGGNPRGKNGGVGNWNVSIPTNASGFPDSTSYVSTITSSVDQAHGCPPVAANDNGYVWYEGHADCDQTAAGQLENIFEEDYECQGDNMQPVFFQQQSGGTQTLGAVTASGKTFSLSAIQLLSPGYWLNVPPPTVPVTGATYSAGSGQATITTALSAGFAVGRTVTIAGVTPSGYNGTFTALSGTIPNSLVVALGSDPGGAATRFGTASTSTAAEAYQSRRITAVHYVPEADFTASFVSQSTTLTITLPQGGNPILQGMTITRQDGTTTAPAGIPSNDTIGVQDTPLQTGESLGGSGRYEMSIKAGATGSSAMAGKAIDGGTFASAFPQDITSPTTLYYAPYIKDFACLNCLLDSAYSGPPGIQGQFQNQNRHMVFIGTTLTNTRYDFAFDTANAGFAAEAITVEDSVLPVAQQDYVSAAPYTPVLGVSLRHTQFTSPTPGQTVLTTGLPYNSAQSFSQTIANLLLGAPTIDAASAAAMPWDINHYPRAAGMPIGAVVH